MSLSDAILRVNQLRSGHIGSLCVLSWTTKKHEKEVYPRSDGKGGIFAETFSWGHDWAPQNARVYISYYSYEGEAVSSGTHMFPIRWVFIRPHDVLGTMDASHLVDIRNKSEGLVKQTQYIAPPKTTDFHLWKFSEEREGRRGAKSMDEAVKSLSFLWRSVIYCNL